MLRINTMNQWNRLVSKRQLASHNQTGIVKSFLGFSPGFDVGFANAHGDVRALAWMAKRRSIKIGPSLTRQINLKSRNHDGYLN